MKETIDLLFVAVLAVVSYFVGIRRGRKDCPLVQPKRMMLVTVRSHSMSQEEFKKLKEQLEMDQTRMWTFAKVSADAHLPHDPFIQEI